MTIQEVRASVELVQLPSGKIVRADSQEGKAHQAPEAPAQTETAERKQNDNSMQPDQNAPTPAADDEAQRIWAAMGLPRRAWSQSPPPSPEQRRHAHHQSLNNPNPAV